MCNWLNEQKRQIDIFINQILNGKIHRLLDRKIGRQMDKLKDRYI